MRRTSGTAATDRAAGLERLTLLGWGRGAAGIAVLGFSRTIVMRFMTDYLELSALLAGTLFALSKLFDALTDPLMGVVSDRTETRWGRRRPYLLAGAFLCAAAYVPLFTVPDLASAQVLTLYVAAALLFYAIAYPVFNVPYLALAVEIAPGYHERSRLMSARAVGIAAGTLLAGVSGPLMIVASGGGVAGHRAMSWSLALLTLALLLACVASLPRIPSAARERRSLARSVRTLSSLRANAPYLRLLIAKTLFVVGISVLTTLSAYFVTHVLEEPDTTLSLFFGAFFVGVIASQPLWLALSRRYDKRRAYVGACLSLATLNMSWLFAGPNEPAALFVARSAAVGLTMGGAMTVGLSMLPDTFELDARLNGTHREGVLAGFYTTVEKGGVALGIAVVAVALRLADYVESDAGASARQSVETVRMLKVAFAVLPALALAASAFAMRRYALTESTLTTAAREGVERIAIAPTSR